ncbi:MAG TPA: MBL fold metallo-hydrolase [Thermoanaerobaculia bacterium]|nr:MBL fold metallo-hydrolase [Thermoanaerobaculia bacterium]
MTADNAYFTLPTEHFTIEGRSRAGQETWFRIRELNIGLDIGRGPDALVPMPHVFVTHAHLDHAAGIPFHAGQRKLNRLGGGKVYIPSVALDDYRALMAIHERLEGAAYDIELVGLAPGDVAPLGRTHYVRTHRATHRVPANAYEVVERRHRLKPEYAGIDGETLARLRYDGTAIMNEVEVPLLFYTGDTDRGILKQNEAIYRAEVVMIECSYIADGHQEPAAKYRHIHFDDIAEFAERFESALVVLTHFSRRYSRTEIVEELRRRCPAVLRDRIRLAFPPPWQTL